jgi:hypothetical protein
MSEAAAKQLCEEGMFTMAEAMAHSKLSRSELYAAMNRNELATVKFGKRRLVPKRSLTAMLAAKLVNG